MGGRRRGSQDKLDRDVVVVIDNLVAVEDHCRDVRTSVDHRGLLPLSPRGERSRIWTTVTELAFAMISIIYIFTCNKIFAPSSYHHFP
jgi:hypothetical protein